MVKSSLDITPSTEAMFGLRDENLRLMERELGVTIDLRSHGLVVEGEQEPVERVERLFQDFDGLRRSGVSLAGPELHALLKLAVADPTTTLKSLVDSGRQRTANGVKRMVNPRSPNQKKYVEAIEQADMTFGIGPAGTGKTYLAVAMAASALMAKRVSRIILVRPAVEAGERLGFLPGSLQEKIDPYLRPLYDALYDLLEKDRVDKMLEKGIIEIAPLAFMRGRTLSDAFIIMDEAQNTTNEQMKMFVTRLEALQVLNGVEGVRFCHFEDADVVRHNLVQRIVRAYDTHQREQQLTLGLGESAMEGAVPRSPTSPPARKTQ